MLLNFLRWDQSSIKSNPPNPPPVRALGARCPVPVTAFPPAVGAGTAPGLCECCEPFRDLPQPWMVAPHSCAGQCSGEGVRGWPLAGVWCSLSLYSPPLRALFCDSELVDCLPAPPAVCSWLRETTRLCLGSPHGLGLPDSAPPSYQPEVFIFHCLMSSVLYCGVCERERE